MSCNSMKKAESETLSNNVVSVYCTWDHWSNGNECQVVFINQKTNKVVYVQQVTKGHGNVTRDF